MYPALAGGLTERLERVLRDAQGVVVAYLFGSRATGRHRPDSDVDVAVLLAVDADPATLAADLQQALAPLTIDLVVLDDAPLPLAYRVVRDGTVLVNRDDAVRTAFWVRTVDRYLDMAPARRILADATRRRLQDGRFGRE